MKRERQATNPLAVLVPTREGDFPVVLVRFFMPNGRIEDGVTLLDNPDRLKGATIIAQVGRRSQEPDLERYIGEPTPLEHAYALARVKPPKVPPPIRNIMRARGSLI